MNSRIPPTILGHRALPGSLDGAARKKQEGDRFRSVAPEFEPRAKGRFGGLLGQLLVHGGQRWHAANLHGRQRVRDVLRHRDL